MVYIDGPPLTVSITTNTDRRFFVTFYKSTRTKEEFRNVQVIEHMLTIDNNGVNSKESIQQAAPPPKRNFASPAPRSSLFSSKK